MSNNESSVEIKIGSDRGFGLVFAVFFAIVSIYPLFSSGHLRIWALTFALVFLVLALTYSRVLHPLNILWFRFGLLLGRVASPIVLAALFFLVFAPIGLVLRACGKDLLNLKKNSAAGSYWIPRDLERHPMQSMRNQF